MRSRPALAALGALVLAGGLAGCGTTSDAATDDDTTSGEEIVLVDASGEDVILDGPAEDIVALEWSQAEVLSSLGANLVGLSDVEGYQSWVGTSVPLTSDPEDVGTRTEPSVERIAELEPDLIVGVPRSVPDEVRDQLEAIAPVLLLKSSDAEDPLGAIEGNVTQLAAATGLEADGEQLVSDFRDGLAERAQKVADSGLEGTPVVFTSPYSDGSTLTIRMHGPRSGAQAVLTEVGLGAAWEDPGDDESGLSYTDIEGLTALPDDSWFLYWANADSDDPVDTYLAGNAVWDSLPFVQAGHVDGIADGVWLYGGPDSLLVYTDEVLAAIGVN